VAAHYADDGTSMIPLMTLMKGKDAIRAGLKEEFSDPNSSLDFHPDKVEVSKSGDMAYSQGKIRLYQHGSQDKEAHDRARRLRGSLQEASGRIVESCSGHCFAGSSARAGKSRKVAVHPILYGSSDSARLTIKLTQLNM